MRGRLAMYVWGPRRDEGDLRDVEVGTWGCPVVRIRGSGWGGPPGRGAALTRALPWLACPSPRGGAP